MVCDGSRRACELARATVSFHPDLLPSRDADPIAVSVQAVPPGGSAYSHSQVLMMIIHVHVHVRPDNVAAFIAVSRDNTRHSIEEPGMVRFDVLQQEDDPSRFLLIEIYRSPDDPARHKATPHYATWRDAVEAMMAEPRRSVKYKALTPETAA